MRNNMRRAQRARTTAAGIAVLSLALLGTGCTENYLGTPSLSLLSTASTADYYRPVGQVRERSECTATDLFLFGSGNLPSHEAAIAKLLEESGGDVLLNAQLTRDRVQLLLYRRDCARVKGQPAKLVERSS
jgi:hypothetical protein